MPINELIAQGSPNPWAAWREEEAGRIENSLLKEKLNYLPQQRAMQQEQFGWERQKNQRDKEVYEHQLEMRPWTDIDTITKGLDHVASKINLDNWDETRGWLERTKGLNQLGINIPSRDELVQKAIGEGITDYPSLERWTQNWVQNKMMSIHAKAAEAKAQKDATQSWGPDTTVKIPGQPAFQTPGRQKEPSETKFQSDIGKLEEDKRVLIEERGYSKDSPIVKAIDEEIKKKSSSTKEPTNVYQDFAVGYKAQLKKDHPDWSQEQIDLATSEEASKRKLTGQIQVITSGAAERGKAFADERFYSMFDTKLGKTVKVKGKFLNEDDGTRYLDPQDPNLKADTQSLVKITKGMDAISGFEKGASQALDYALSVAKDFGAGKYPGANRVSQLFQYHLGDAKVKGLKNAITTAATEYMKVINAGSDLTAAELSVMGQQRAKEIIEGADNFESLKNSIKIMKREMQISGDKFKAQRREVQGRLGGGGQEAPAPSNTADPLGIR